MRKKHQLKNKLTEKLTPIQRNGKKKNQMKSNRTVAQRQRNTQHLNE